MPSQCPKCQNTVDVKNKYCHHCGEDLSQRREVSTTRNSSRNTKNSDIPSIGNKTLLWILAIALIFGIRLCRKNQNNSSDYGVQQNDSRQEALLAYEFAKTYVKNNLKSPSTASFPGTFERIKHIEEIGVGTYRILSWVDSQNAFGAILRTNFSCVVKIDSDKATLVSLEFLH